MMFATDQNMDRSGLSATSKKILALRDAVFARWEQETRRKVPGAADIESPILINTLPAFYDNIAEALTPDFPRSAATSNTDVASAHGNERARMTSYGPAQVIYEYQLFRDAFTHVMEAEGLVLNRAEWAVFHASIDTAVRESVQKFTSMHDSFRQRVAAALSHDMRNPLSAMVQGAQMVLLAPQSEKNKVIAQRMLEHGERLGEMVGELLEALSFNKGDKLPLVLSRFDLFDLTDKVRSQFEQTSPGICELSGTSVVGYWCANSMRRAIENLVTNAIKYGDGGLVRIQVGATHGRMMLSVHNQGNPIQSESRSRIFEYLRREDGSAESGWGIGLPFVRSVAESHGGSVVVDSSAASGTTFMIDTPIDCRPFVDDPGRGRLA